MSDPEGPVPFRSILENHPDYVRAIGMINIEVGNLEITLGRLLGALLNVQDTVGQVVYLTPRSAFGRLEIIENVVDTIIGREGGGHQYLQGLVRRAKAILGKRHELMHGLWGVTDEKVGIYSLPLEGDDAKPKPISLESLHTIIQDIRTLVATVHLTTAQLYRQNYWPQSFYEITIRLGD